MKYGGTTQAQLSRTSIVSMFAQVRVSFRLLHTLSIIEVKWVISNFFVSIFPRFRLTVAVGCQYLYGPHDAGGRAALGVLWVLRLGRSAKASALQRVSDENDH
jgi:hypothetical protein